MTTATQSTNLDPNVVSKRAYEIWEALGRPEGVAEQTWAEAVRQLSGDTATTSAKRDDAPQAKATTPSTAPAAAPVEARVEPKSDATKPISNPPSATHETVTKKENQNNQRRGSRR